jgi:pimeloyl-ACP methyl ester carboxylesterase
MVAGRTMRSRLTHDFRLIAFDLPGHGDSRIFLGVKQLTPVDQPLDYFTKYRRLAGVWNAN